MTEFQGTAAVSPWAKPWSEDSHYRNSRVTSWPDDHCRPPALLLAAITGLVLWVLILSPILLFL
jgi:hypothetical protein